MNYDAELNCSHHLPESNIMKIPYCRDGIFKDNFATMINDAELNCSHHLPESNRMKIPYCRDGIFRR